jgi:hypothetical protein
MMQPLKAAGELKTRIMLDIHAIENHNCTQALQ